MQFAHHSSSSLSCAYCHLPVSTYHAVTNPWRPRSARQQPLTASATQAHLEATVAIAAPEVQQDEGLPLSTNGTYELTAHGTKRKSKYLSYQEYVELAQQQEAAGEPAAAAHAVTEQQSSGHNQPQEAKRRIPWNKGRRHSAVTIAKIRERSLLASQRPEARAKYDAWNHTRVGVSLPEQHKAQIKRGLSEVRAERGLQMASPEELAERRARKSSISRSLWQDPEYAERTKTAMRARAKQKKDREQLEAEGQESSSSGSASRSSTAKPRRRTEVAAERSDGEQQQQEQRAAKQVKQRKPTKKELAAAAAEQQQQLQQQLTRLLQTQQLILTTERTVQQLHANLAAFENNPQSYAVASETMQRAQEHLAQARAQVQQLQQHLDDFGVKWDGNTGQITHIANGLTAQLQLQKLAQKAHKNAGTASPSSSGVPRSKRGRPSGSSSSKTRSSSAEPPDLAPDIVRSQRRAAAVVSPSAAAGSRRASSRNPAAAAAEAAEAGGSRSNPGSLPAVAPQLTGVGSSTVGLNGHGRHLSNMNGHSNGHSSGVDGSKYVTVQLQSAEEAED